MALEQGAADNEVFNIGGGEEKTVNQVAEAVARAMGRPEVTPEVTGKTRVGDIRHCIPDISKAQGPSRLRAEAGLRSRPRRTGRMGRTAGVDRSGAGGPARAGSPGPGGMSADGVPGLAAPAIRAVRPVLVTGGAGFIGCNLADRLAREGHDVVVYDCLARAGVEQNLDWLKRRHPQRISAVIADIRDASSLDAVARDASAVFHLAAQVAVTTSLTAPVEDFDVNVRATLSLLESLRTAGGTTPVVFASTNKVYGDLDDLEMRLEEGAYTPTDPTVRRYGVPETRPLDFHTPYGCSKGAADQYVLDYARSTSACRLRCCA